MPKSSVWPRSAVVAGAAATAVIAALIAVIPWEPRLHKVKLLVAVSTHLERVEQRQAIRGTWKRALANLSREVDVVFFSGEKPCHLDPQWRRTESGCRPWNVFVPVGVNENVAVRPFRAVSTDRDHTNDAPAAAGVTFVLKFPVTVAQLGIARRALEAFRPASGNVTVELLNVRNGEVQAEANFSREDLNGGHSGDDGFFYKQVDAENHQKGFEGLLRIRPESAPEINFSCSLVWNRLFGEDGLVIFTGVYSADGGHYVPLEPTSNPCPLVSLIYQVPDIVELRQVMNAKDTQNKCQENKIKSFQGKVVEELEDYDDLFLVPELTDTTENSPTALLEFVQWSATQYSFDALLVTRDDSFVAVERLLSGVAFAAARSWRSQFRKSKLKEADSALVPADSGSLLSKDLVSYLAENALVLSTPTGAGVGDALAAWLRNINVRVVEDANFALNNSTCSTQSLVFGPINGRKNMKEAWTNFKKCGMMCGCVNVL